MPRLFKPNSRERPTRTTVIGPEIGYFIYRVVCRSDDARGAAGARRGHGGGARAQQARARRRARRPRRQVRPLPSAPAPAPAPAPCVT